MFLTADGAKEFGIIDKVMEKRPEDMGELIAAVKHSLRPPERPQNAVARHGFCSATALEIMDFPLRAGLVLSFCHKWWWKIGLVRPGESATCRGRRPCDR